MHNQNEENLTIVLIVKNYDKLFELYYLEANLSIYT